MRPSDDEIEKAKSVLAAAREQRDAEEQAKALTYVGRFFRFSNSYSLERGGRWWIYGAITGAAHGMPQGWTFQRTVEDIIKIEAQDSIPVDYGRWEEITAEEFWAAAKTLLETIEPLLRFGGREVLEFERQYAQLTRESVLDLVNALQEWLANTKAAVPPDTEKVAARGLGELSSNSSERKVSSD